jgi:hypothetical protein
LDFLTGGKIDSKLEIKTTKNYLITESITDSKGNAHTITQCELGFYGCGKSCVVINCEMNKV